MGHLDSCIWVGQASLRKGTAQVQLVSSPLALLLGATPAVSDSLGPRAASPSPRILGLGVQSLVSYVLRLLAWDSEGLCKEGCLHLPPDLPSQSSAFKAAMTFFIQLGRREGGRQGRGKLTFNGFVTCVAHPFLQPHSQCVGAVIIPLLPSRSLEDVNNRLRVTGW